MAQTTTTIKTKSYANKKASKSLADQWAYITKSQHAYGDKNIRPNRVS